MPQAPIFHLKLIPLIAVLSLDQEAVDKSRADEASADVSPLLVADVLQR